MISEETGKKLHDRVTRGKILSPEERNLLQTWYEAQDEEESRLLSSGTETETALRKQTDSVLIRIGTVSSEIRKTIDDNNMLKEEIRRLQQQLSQKITADAT
jgi:peptidoglycan hydrolase CwlO-like protein